MKLKGWQQAAVAVGSAVGALLDPRRADLIAALGETTGKPAFERVLERMKASPEGRVSFFFHFINGCCSLNFLGHNIYIWGFSSANLIVEISFLI